MTQSRAEHTLWWPVKILVAAWLGASLLGALNHSILPRFGFQFPLSYPPHLRFGYVMFNQSPERVTLVDYQPAGSLEWHHLADMIETAAPFYKRSRVLIDFWMGSFPYVVTLCVKEPEAQGALFRFKYEFPGNPGAGSEELFRCQDGRFYPP